MLYVHKKKIMCEASLPKTFVKLEVYFHCFVQTSGQYV